MIQKRSAARACFSQQLCGILFCILTERAPSCERHRRSRKVRLLQCPFPLTFSHSICHAVSGHVFLFHSEGGNKHRRIRRKVHIQWAVDHPQMLACSCHFSSCFGCLVVPISVRSIPVSDVLTPFLNVCLILSHTLGFHWLHLAWLRCAWLPSFLLSSLPSFLPFFLPPSFLPLGFGLARLHSAQLDFTVLSLARLHSVLFGLASLCSAWLGSALRLVFGKLSAPLHRVCFLYFWYVFQLFFFVVQFFIYTCVDCP